MSQASNNIAHGSIHTMKAHKKVSYFGTKKPNFTTNQGLKPPSVLSSAKAPYISNPKKSINDSTGNLDKPPKYC